MSNLASLLSLPRFHLMAGPTPLEELTRLSDAVRQQAGSCPRLFVKRDDLTGLANGGNKTRKLEFLIGDAITRGADTIITTGALQSNHARQTAAAASKAGLKCVLLLFDTVDHGEPAYRQSGNILLDHLLGADVRIAPASANPIELFDSTIAEMSKAGRTPYVIPAGGSNSIGGMGYVNAMVEIQDQAQAEGLVFDRIIHASSTFGTQAGLVMGAHLLDLDTQVTGINVYKRQSGTQVDALDDQLAGLAKFLETDVPSSDRYSVRGEFLGEGYGLPSPEMRAALELVAQTEGLLLDPVYTGKAMAGLFALIFAGQIPADETVLFVHTGGTPGLFAYAEALSN